MCGNTSLGDYAHPNSLLLTPTLTPVGPSPRPKRNPSCYGSGILYRTSQGPLSTISDPPPAPQPRSACGMCCALSARTLFSLLYTPWLRAKSPRTPLSLMPTLTHVTISLSGILTPTPPDSLLRADEQPYVLTEDNRAGPRVGFGVFGLEL